MTDTTVPRTLGDEALSHEGEPIASDQLLRVDLLDSNDMVVEYKTLSSSDSADELVKWVGEYVAGMGAEGMSGTVTWRTIYRSTGGLPHPDYVEGVTKRFEINIHSHDPEDEEDWRCKLQLIDKKYQDDDQLHVDAIAAGCDWDAAYKRAGEMIVEAAQTNHCIFI